jgi:hypothetical protein
MATNARPAPATPGPPTVSHAEAMLDDALAATFPASDPPANAVVTGVGLGNLPTEPGAPGAQARDRRGRRATVTTNDDDRSTGTDA